MSSVKISSFKSLGETPLVTSQELITTLENYANTNAAITAQVVIDLIQKTDLSEKDLQKLKAAAETGANAHIGMSDKTTFVNLPAEIAVKTSLLTRLEYGNKAKIAHQDTEMGEAVEYQKVVNWIDNRFKNPTDV